MFYNVFMIFNFYHSHIKLKCLTGFYVIKYNQMHFYINISGWHTVLYVINCYRLYKKENLAHNQTDHEGC